MGRCQRRQSVLLGLFSTHWRRQKPQHWGYRERNLYTQIRGALKTYGYQNWTFVKTAKRSRAGRDEETRKPNNIFILYAAGTPETLRRIYNKHHITVHFKPNNTLRQKLVHPKDKTPPRHKQSNVVYAVRCSRDCTDLYIGETKQPLHKWMAQHRRASSSGHDFAVHLHLKEKKHSFDDNSVNISARGDRWFERGVNESIYFKLEQSSLNRGGGLRHDLSPTYNAVLSSENNHSCMVSSNPSNPHEGRLGQRPTRGPKDTGSHTCP